VEALYIDTRLRDGTILDVLDENVAKVCGARVKATWGPVSQGVKYTSMNTYVIPPGMVMSRPAITDILHIIGISPSNRSERI
jgi:hypothetical protein